MKKFYTRHLLVALMNWQKIRNILLRSGKWRGDELKRHRAKESIEIVEGGTIDEFDIDLYFRMIEKMGVFE